MNIDIDNEVKQYDKYQKSANYRFDGTLNDAQQLIQRFGHDSFLLEYNSYKVGFSVGMKAARAENLKKLRAAAGVTLQETAEAVGVTANTMRRYENGTRIPGDSIKLKLGEYFHVPPTLFY